MGYSSIGSVAVGSISSAGGMWTLVEPRYVVSGSAVTSKTFSGLDGNTAIRYRLVARVIKANDQNLEGRMTFNNDTGSTSYRHCYTQLNTSQGNTSYNVGMNHAFFQWCYSESAVVVSFVNVEIDAMSGVNRPITGYTRQLSAADSYYANEMYALWKNTSDNITSIELSFGTNGIGVGSYIELWKLSDSYATPSGYAEIGLACSDESTDLATGTSKLTFRMPYAMYLTSVRANVNTAPTGAALVVNVKKNGSSIFSTKVNIDAGTKTNVSSATPCVISDSSLTDDAEITVDIDQVGSTVAGKGLKLWLRGQRL